MYEKRIKPVRTRMNNVQIPNVLLMLRPAAQACSRLELPQPGVEPGHITLSSTWRLTLQTTHCFNMQVRQLGRVLHLWHLVRCHSTGLPRPHSSQRPCTAQGLLLPGGQAAPGRRLGRELPVLPGQGGLGSAFGGYWVMCVCAKEVFCDLTLLAGSVM